MKHKVKSIILAFLFAIALAKGQQLERQVIAAGGYPGSYRKGDVIKGLMDAQSDHGKVFHAGTRVVEGRVVTNGGRVLCATALGNSVSEAQRAAYELAAKIEWDGSFYRNDIAYRAIAREQNK